MEQMAPGRLLCSSTSATILVNSKGQEFKHAEPWDTKTPANSTEECSFMGKVAQPLNMWLLYFFKTTSSSCKLSSDGLHNNALQYNTFMNLKYM